MSTKTEKTQAEKDIEKYYSQKIYADESALTNQFNNTVGDLRGQKKDNTEAIGEQNRNLYTQYMRDSAVLPEQLARSGITGGAVESSNLRLMSDYRNNVAENDRALFKANEDIDTEISDLKAQYEAAMAESRAENEFNKAQALEAASKPAAGLSENQKAALEAYKLTGDASWLNGYFSTEQINNMTKGTTGGGNGNGANAQTGLTDELWKTYERTGFATPFFEAGYTPEQAISIMKHNSVIYDASGNQIAQDFDESSIWKQWLDYSISNLGNESTQSDAFSIGQIMVGNTWVNAQDVANGLSGEAPKYAIYMQNGVPYVTYANTQSYMDNQTGTVFGVDGSTEQHTLTEISAGLMNGTYTFSNGKYYKTEIPADIKATLYRAEKEGTRQDDNIANKNIGQYIYFPNHGWLTLAQVDLYAKRGSVTVTEVGGRYLYSIVDKWEGAPAYANLNSKSPINEKLYVNQK